MGIDWDLAGSVILSGLVIVFLILIILILAVMLVNRFVKGASEKSAAAHAPKPVAPKPSAPKPVAPPAPAVKAAAPAPAVPVIQSGITGETVAAISAAVYACMDEAVPGVDYIIKSVARVEAARPVWGFAGMRQNTRPF